LGFGVWAQGFWIGSLGTDPGAVNIAHAARTVPSLIRVSPTGALPAACAA